MKLLPERNNVNPNPLGKKCTTSLAKAAQKGHEDVVKSLLEYLDINPNPMDDDGQRLVLGTA